MLIAIMGRTLEENGEKEEQVKYKEHLRFIIENWSIIPNHEPYFVRFGEKIYRSVDNVYEGFDALTGTPTFLQQFWNWCMQAIG